MQELRCNASYGVLGLHREGVQHWKIVCESNIDDIRGNTMLVANYLFFRKFNYSLFFEILFWGWFPMLQLSTKKISLKSDTERRKYARLSGLVPFFAC